MRLEEDDRFDCDFPGRCLMPGVHMLSECYTREMAEERARENDAAAPDDVSTFALKLWARLNERRCHLIERNHAGVASDAERIELAQLQTLADECICVFAPLPIAELEAYMKSKGIDVPAPDDNRITPREARDRALQLSRETDERLAEERRREAAPDDIAILAADLASEPIDRSGCQCADNEYCPTCEAELAALHAAHDELARDDAAPFTDVWVDAVRLQKRVQELEAQLAAKEQTIADLRDLAYERAPKIAAEELRRQKEEYEAR